MIHVNNDGIHDHDGTNIVPFRLGNPLHEGKPGNLSVQNYEVNAGHSGFTTIVVTYVTSDDVTVHNRWNGGEAGEA